MNILIPMAGEGSRFQKEGFNLPKPLIDVFGKPMIQRVIENLRFDANYIFLVRRSHLENYNIQEILKSSTDDKCKIISVDSLTEGAACTALLSKNLIDSEEELLIANSDQLVDYSKENFNVIRNNTHFEGIVFTFNSLDSKWSFVKTDNNGLITKVAEKDPISDIATCGIYYYKRGKDFVRCAEKMIEKNIRVNNEFYIAPVYNEFIEESKKLIPFYVDRMYGLGTPEDLRSFLNKLRE